MKERALIIFTICACLGTVTAKAADEKFALLYPAESEVTVVRGETFSLVLNLDNNIIPSSFQFYIGPPEGITVVKNKLKFDITYTDRLDPEVYSLNAMQVEGTNDVVIVNYNQLEYNTEEADEYKIQPGNGAFATVKFAVSADMEPGEYDLSIYKILFVTLDEEKYWSPDATVKVNVVKEISSITEPVIDNQAQADIYYTLTGQCIVKPTSGIYIINGKKVMVQ